MTTIRTFTNPAEASICSSVLQSAGFDPILLDELASTFGAGSTFAIPIRLQVPEDQAAEATSFLDSADTQQLDPSRETE